MMIINSFYLILMKRRETSIKTFQSRCHPVSEFITYRFYFIMSNMFYLQ